jgi:hypothetical protein
MPFPHFLAQSNERPERLDRYRNASTYLHSAPRSRTGQICFDRAKARQCLITRIAKCKRQRAMGSTDCEGRASMIDWHSCKGLD